MKDLPVHLQKNQVLILMPKSCLDFHIPKTLMVHHETLLVLLKKYTGTLNKVKRTNL